MEHYTASDYPYSFSALGYESILTAAHLAAYMAELLTHDKELTNKPFPAVGLHSMFKSIFEHLENAIGESEHFQPEKSDKTKTA
ncbi:TPA: hypothetical protein PXP51_003303 [Yersinia enterocolitica]|nr:hypothetical protein [Yersinia enterocolitica]